MLLVCTPNPTIDRTLLTPGFRTAEVTRVAETHEAAGGKGLNVVRVAGELGFPARVCAPLGGMAGRRIAELCAQEGLDARWSWLVSGESRTCVIVIDCDAPDTLVLNEHGPQVNRDDWGALAALVLEQADHADALAISGSLPPGVQVEWFVDLVQTVIHAGTPVMLDTSGAALKAALDLPLALLKVNAAELSEALDKSITNIEQAYDASEHVRQRGPQRVIVTLGKAGAVAVGPDGGWAAQPPEVQAISPVGSGDALLAGVATALLKGHALAAALRLGIACGAANTRMIGGGRLSATDVQALEAGITLQALV